MTDSFASNQKNSAREAAYAAVEVLNAKSTSMLEYQSRGHILVLGNKSAAGQYVDLPEPLTMELIEVDSTEEVLIEGALGQFVVKHGKVEKKADLVLDLSPEPQLSMALKPPGYVFVDVEQDAPNEVIDTLVEMVGTFDKPRYFNYDESLCAHGRSGKPGCTRCIDACPAEAITSLINKVEVDPYRCQGGGICATVCPSGAIAYAFPYAEDLQKHLRTLIFTYIDQGGGAPEILFVTEQESDRALLMLPSALVVKVEEVASVGPDVWLSALAWGARNIQLFDLDGMPEPARKALDINVEMVEAMLSGMSYPPSVLSVIIDQGDLLATKSMPAIERAKHAAFGQKRQTLFMALDHLVEQSLACELPVELPQGSIFGEAIVNQDACTLCMSCVSACPGNALQDGGDKPSLGFLEENCYQCGICETTCPEGAISIKPRIVYDPKVRKKPRSLHEEQPFCCLSCGKPFATLSGITAILGKLEGHSMFGDERSKQRLKMCGDCRVKDMMEDPNVDL
ncbi:MAG: ferredoxin [Saprospiraceae bacterium]|jgi:ferredoxin